jgi:hypothetical protein
MATLREQLEEERSRYLRARLLGGVPIRAGYYDEVCQCGHVRGAHQGVIGVLNCMERCDCQQFTSRSPIENIPMCVCGHTFVEHNVMGRCWQVECDCQQYRQDDGLPRQVSVSGPAVPGPVVPVRDDVTSFPSMGYIMRDDEQWFVVIARTACVKPDGLKWSIDWPRRWVWMVKCVRGPQFALNRCLTASLLWQMPAVRESEIGNSVFETPEEAFEKWQTYLRVNEDAQS